MSVPAGKGERLSMSACFLLLLVCAIWGSNAVSIKFSNQGFPPLMAATLRSLVAGILVWGLALWKGQPILFPPGERRHAVVIGILFGLDFLFLYWGISFTPASRSTIFLYSHPLWVILGAHFVLQKDQLSYGKIAGAVLSFTGLILIFKTESAMLPEYHWIGDLMEISAAIFWAATTLYIKRISQSVKLNHYQTLFSQLIFAIPVLAAGAFFFEQGQPVVLNRVVIAALLYQILAVAFFSYLCWFWLIHNHPVSKLASFSFLAPVFGVIFGSVILNEPIGLSVLAGLSFVCVGIFLANK